MSASTRPRGASRPSRTRRRGGSCSGATSRSAPTSSPPSSATSVNTLPHPDLVIVPAFEDRIEVVDLLPPADDLDEARARLVERPLIHADRPVFTQIVERLAARGMLGEDLLVCGDLELVKSLALGGVGAAILPRRVARYGHVGALHPIHPDLPSFADTIHAVWRADLPRTRAWRVLKEALLASAGQMGPPGDP
ncbi:MAG: LysR family transcriptional regulator substrate-binding protein [Myxococcales bacterium]|nr:LysR family transcriptional regulator substrate-binding protein [Myxococcales bacterium]